MSSTYIGIGIIHMKKISQIISFLFLLTVNNKKLDSGKATRLGLAPGC